MFFVSNLKPFVCWTCLWLSSAQLRFSHKIEAFFQLIFFCAGQKGFFSQLRNWRQLPYTKKVNTCNKCNLTEKWEQFYRSALLYLYQLENFLLHLIYSSNSEESLCIVLVISTLSKFSLAAALAYIFSSDSQLRYSAQILSSDSQQRMKDSKFRISATLWVIHTY